MFDGGFHFEQPLRFLDFLALLPVAYWLKRSAARGPRPAAPLSRLRFQGEVTQTNLTRLILTLRPHADPATLTRLMQELDAALYGRQGLDCARWKRDFMRQVGRGAGLSPHGRLAGRIKRATLPVLNPGH